MRGSRIKGAWAGRALVFGATALVFAAVAEADDRPVFTVDIKDHRFSPSTLEVPAGTRFVLEVRNLDRTPEEFESYELNREVVVPGLSTGKINIGPLKAGSYPYFGEFNRATATGTLVAK